MAAGTDGGGYEVIANANGFALDIPGCPEASKNVRNIHIDDLTVDARELTTGLDVQYRLFGPGHAHWGSAKFTVAVTHKSNKEFHQWFMDASRGKGIRKNITVTLYKSDKTPGRSYNLMDCFPTQWASVNFHTGSEVHTETITVKMGRVEFKT